MSDDKGDVIVGTFDRSYRGVVKHYACEMCSEIHGIMQTAGGSVLAPPRSKMRLCSRCVGDVAAALGPVCLRLGDEESYGDAMIYSFIARWKVAPPNLSQADVAALLEADIRAERSRSVRLVSDDALPVVREREVRDTAYVEPSVAFLLDMLRGHGVKIPPGARMYGVSYEGERVELSEVRVEWTEVEKVDERA